MTLKVILLSVLVVLAPLAQAAEPAPPPEPADYRYDDYRSPVPLTLQGAQVVDTETLARRLADHHTVVIDVLPQEPRPPRLAPTNVWMPPPHEGIDGAIWLPNVGYGQLPPALLTYFTDSLRQVTGGDWDRDLVFYCRVDCWMSWNSAKRALSLGYRHVLWYRDGIETWRDAGNKITILKPFGDGPPSNLE